MRSDGRKSGAPTLILSKRFTQCLHQIATHSPGRTGDGCNACHMVFKPPPPASATMLPAHEEPQAEDQ